MTIPPKDGMAMGIMMPDPRPVRVRALNLCGGNRSKTASYLGIPKHMLVYRISKYEIG
ncbi:MAG: hypothetical protein KAH56_03025 [Candidatus Krumholzibacteria bacterium]|nr:hypothetical protein [Candidatus Krumholzibacteria bacterium]